jgi:hypothetical protein
MTTKTVLLNRPFRTVTVPNVELVVPSPAVDVLITYNRLLSRGDSFLELERVEFLRESYESLEQLQYANTFRRGYADVSAKVSESIRWHTSTRLPVEAARSIEERLAFATTTSLAKEFYESVEQLYYTVSFSRGFNESAEKAQELLSISGLKPILEVAQSTSEGFSLSYVVPLPKEVMAVVAEQLRVSFSRGFNESAEKAQELLSISGLKPILEVAQSTSEGFSLSYVVPLPKEVMAVVAEQLSLSAAFTRAMVDSSGITAESGLFRKTSFCDPSYFLADYIEDQRITF